MLKNWELPCFFLVKPKTPNNGFPDSDGWSEVWSFWEDWMLLREIYYVMFSSQYSTTKNRSLWYALIESHENLGCIPAKSCIPEPQNASDASFWCLIPPWPWQIWDLPSYSSLKSRQQTKPLIFRFWVFEFWTSKFWNLVHQGLHWNSLAYRTETQVVEAKNMAQKRIGDEEEKSRVLQLEVQILKNLKRQSSWNTEKRNSQLHMSAGL